MPDLPYPVSIFSTVLISKSQASIRISADSAPGTVMVSFISLLRELIRSISRILSGNAIKMSFHPSEAKYSAILIDETVMDSIPASLNQVPIILDWCVLKCGRSSIPDFLAFPSIISMLRLHLISSTTRVGLVIFGSIFLFL